MTIGPAAPLLFKPYQMFAFLFVLWSCSFKIAQVTPPPEIPDGVEEPLEAKQAIRAFPAVGAVIVIEHVNAFVDEPTACLTKAIAILMSHQLPKMTAHNLMWF